MAAKKRTGAKIIHGKPLFADVVKTHKNFRSNFHNALRYMHYEMNSVDLKKEVMTYLRTLDAKHPYLDKIKNIPENKFSVIGKYTYIINHGGELPDDVIPSLMPAIEREIDAEEKKIAKAEKEVAHQSRKAPATKDSSVPVRPVPTIQDRLREKAAEVSEEIEGWIDDFLMSKKGAVVKSVEEFSNLFKAKELKAPHMRYMQSFFERRAAEIALAATGTDQYLNEAYSNFTKPELKKFDSMFKNLFKACDMMQEVAKVTRAPRKKKPLSQEKLVSKLKYKKEDSSLGIVSLNPVQIIGAKEVWIYNSKTRKLAQYKEYDMQGLGVKGASLTNYSQDSVEKTLRKPVEVLAEFKKSSKVKLRTFMKDIGTVDVACNGKLNEHHIILRIDK